jgi:hypothetical protein
MNQTCTAGKCQNNCNLTCTAGCCDAAGTCQLGFFDNQCGSGAANCVDCTTMRGTCNTSATPRVCSGPATNCPVAYGTCPAGVTTAAQVRHQNVCAASDLAQARIACGGAGAPYDTSCTNYFTTLTAINPACARCMKPFDKSFSELSGLYACVAPFVSAACDHNTGCADDCRNVSCAMCAMASSASCRTSVQTGQCATEFAAANCFNGGLTGMGSFCNPASGMYRGNYGAWLQGVASQYCGP